MFRGSSRLLCLALASSALAAQPSDPSPGLTRIELTCVDPQATGYGTFQSHNQKVVANRRGIFMTHIRSRNEAYTAQQWRLSWSRDGGKTFETLYEATHPTNPAVLETDDQDNLYLIRPDFVDGHAYLYRFRAAQDYRQPAITCVTNGSAGKFSMALDLPRRQLYYFAHNNTFHRISLDGTVLSSTNLLAAGKSAALQYPLLYLDAGGILHAAWTTQKHGVYLYWDIHYLQSPDGGLTWRTMRGTPVALPAIADQGGPADRITLDDEFEVHTWLESFFARAGKAHFLYLAQAQPPRQHYVRYDLATAKRELDLQPDFRGQQLSLRNLDGFFAARAAQTNGTIYAVSHDANANRLACLASDDNGATWYDYAVSGPVTNAYSVGGCREITRDGYIIGSFTEQAASTTNSNSASKVYFLKIKAGLAKHKPRASGAEPQPPTPAAQTTRIAGIVLKWLRGDKAANYRRAEPLIRDAAAHGAQIVCTTECFLDGYAIADKTIPLEQYRALGELIPQGEYFRKLSALARELNILLIAGMLETDGEARYNTAVSIGPKGELLGKYHKQRLDHEAVRNSAGAESSTFDTSYGKLGVMICADRRFPEVVKAFSDGGADFLICPSGGMFGPKSNDPIVQGRSRENHKYIVFVHPAEFLVTGPDGTIVQQALLGDKLLISPDQIGTEADSKQVFYFDLPRPPKL